MAKAKSATIEAPVAAALTLKAAYEQVVAERDYAQAEVAKLLFALEAIERSGGRDGVTHSGDGHAQCRQLAAMVKEGVTAKND